MMTQYYCHPSQCIRYAGINYHSFGRFSCIYQETMSYDDFQNDNGSRHVPLPNASHLVSWHFPVAPACYETPEVCGTNTPTWQIHYGERHKSFRVVTLLNSTQRDVNKIIFCRHVAKHPLLVLRKFSECCSGQWILHQAIMLFTEQLLTKN